MVRDKMTTEEEWQLIIDQINEQENLDLSLAPTDELTVYEIVVYAYLIATENGNYGEFEVTVYTTNEITVADVFREIEVQGFRLWKRTDAINRVDINQLKIGRMPRELPNGRKISKDWAADILDQLFAVRLRPKLSGHAYRKRAGITESEYKRQQREKRQEKVERKQEQLDKYGLE